MTKPHTVRHEKTQLIFYWKEFILLRSTKLSFCINCTTTVLVMSLLSISSTQVLTRLLVYQSAITILKCISMVKKVQKLLLLLSSSAMKTNVKLIN